jgi:hypothetical protein
MSHTGGETSSAANGPNGGRSQSSGRNSPDLARWALDGLQPLPSGAGASEKADFSVLKTWLLAASDADDKTKAVTGSEAEAIRASSKRFFDALAGSSMGRVVVGVSHTGVETSSAANGGKPVESGTAGPNGGISQSSGRNSSDLARWALDGLQPLPSGAGASEKADFSVPKTWLLAASDADDKTKAVTGSEAEAIRASSKRFFDALAGATSADQSGSTQPAPSSTTAESPAKAPPASVPEKNPNSKTQVPSAKVEQLNSASAVDSASKAPSTSGPIPAPVQSSAQAPAKDTRKPAPSLPTSTQQEKAAPNGVASDQKQAATTAAAAAVQSSSFAPAPVLTAATSVTVAVMRLQYLDGRQAEIELSVGRRTIGRGATNDIRVDSRNLSR